MDECFRKLCKGKGDRRSIRAAINSKEAVIRKARELMLSGEYRCAKPRRRDIVSGSKNRSITYTRGVIDPLIRHCVSRAILLDLLPKMPRGVASNIEGRGSAYLMNMMIKEGKSGKYRYYLLEDIRNYFNSIDKDILLRIIKEETGCEDPVIDIVGEMLKVCDDGIAIGTVDCQVWANVFLMQLDRAIVNRFGSKIAYGRYCDNMYMMADSVEILHDIHKYIRAFVKRIGISMNPCEFGRLEDGMRVLSVVIFPDHVRIRKRVKEAMRRSESVSSYFGFLKIADTINLIRKVMYNKFEDIIDIPEYIMSFTGDKRELPTLVGKRIIVTDCLIEKSKFKNKNGEHRDRAKIAFKFNDDDSREYICFTSSRQILHYCRAFISADKKHLPMQLTIKKNHNQYIFSKYEDQQI